MDNTNIIEDIASKHLGKTSDGATMVRYETPDDVDASLLVGIPRVLNRTQYNIDEDNLPFVGFDTWNAYEVSFLLDNGYPVSGVLKLVYCSESVNIVESKSIKLYLNSFNMAKMGATIDEAIRRASEIIEKDLTEVIGTEVVAHLHRGTRVYDDMKPISNGLFRNLEDEIDVTSLTFDQYNEDPAILVVESHDRKNTWWHTTNNLRSNCRVTNQPDWGTLYIAIEGSDTITPESLMEYVVSMRRENHFHEEICECVTKRLIDLLPNSEVMVACLYTRRGGIDINPVRASSSRMLLKYATNLISENIPHIKTEAQ